MTFLTPFIDIAFEASKEASLPPNTGHSLMVAFSMPGSLRSAPYTCLPVTLSRVSRRFTGLPMTFHSDGLFSLIASFAGGVSLEAAAATLPYVVVRPEPLCVMTLLAAVHSEAGTPHWLAAACTSIMRAAAPPWRT